MKAFGSLTAGPWAPVEVVPSSAAGKSLLVVASGMVVSVQPEGHVEYRPAGTDGPYEQAVIDAGIVTYCPDGLTAWPFGIRSI